MRPLSDIDWRNMSREEIDIILAERVNAYEAHIEERGGKRPKREGHVVERIASMENLRAADIEAQKGKTKITVRTEDGKEYRVPNRHIRRHNRNAEEELRAIQMMLLTCEFPDPGFRREDIKTDAGKTRELIKQNYSPWRILQHSIMRVASPYIHKSLTMDCFACIKGKGLHWGMKRVKRKLRLHPELKWMWKTDFKKYYQSIPHQLVEECFRRLFKDEFLIRIIGKVMLAYDSGEELLKCLEDERLRNERNPYRGGVEPDGR